MKIRQGFVSNSSSSSFIIATRKGADQSLIKDELLEKYHESLERFLESEDFGYCYDTEDIKTVEDLAARLAARMAHFGNNDLILDDWRVGSQEIYSEDCDAADMFLYMHGYELNRKVNDSFKMG
jgi:hypothetical protein